MLRNLGFFKIVFNGKGQWQDSKLKSSVESRRHQSTVRFWM